VASNTSTGTRNVTVTTTGGMTSPVSLSVGP
jgi:hypothetical protein